MPSDLSALSAEPPPRQYGATAEDLLLASTVAFYSWRPVGQPAGTKNQTLETLAGQHEC